MLHQRKLWIFSTIPVVRELLSNISPEMLLVTCHMRDMLRGVVVSTPWCDAAVAGALSNIFVATDWDWGRQPGLPGRDSVLACGFLTKSECFKLCCVGWYEVTNLSRLLPSSAWCGWRIPRQRRWALRDVFSLSARIPRHHDTVHCECCVRAWRHCLQPLNCRPVDL